MVLPLKDENGWFVGTGRSGLYKLVIQDFNSLYISKLGVRNNIRSIYEVGEDSLLTTSALLYTQKGGVDLRVKMPKLKFVDSLNFINSHKISGNPSWIDKLPPYIGALTSNFIGAGNFIQDSTGAFWYSHPEGVIRASPPSQTYPDDIQNGYRGSFYNPSKNEIWSTSKEGIRVFSIANRNYSWIPEFNNKHVRNVVFSNTGIAWICIVGKGLYSWDGEKLTAYPLDFKEALRYCHTVVEDNNGFLWISTDNGLFKTSVEELIHFKDHPEKKIYYYRFDKENGFLTNEFNGSGFPCGLKMSNGKIAFSSLIGAVLFDPEEVKVSSFKYKLILDEIFLDGKDTLIDEKRGLDQNFNQLEFHLSYSYFGELHNLVLDYKVEGLQEKWHSVPPDNVITLGQLNYGEYKLVVRRKNGFGIDNFTYLNYPFKVNPRFFETFGFKVLIGFAIIIIIVGLLLLNSWVAKLKRIRLEQIIHEKTEEQLVLNEELKLNLAKVQQSEVELRDNTEMKDKFMAIYTHDVRGPLRFVKTITSISIKRINDIDQKEMIQRLEDIETSTHQVYLLTEHMFHWLRSQKDDFALKTETFSLNGLIDKVLKQYAKQAKNKSIELK